MYNITQNGRPMQAFRRRDRLEQTALAQVPEETVVQTQPTLKSSRLIVSRIGQHESCNRTYDRTMYLIFVVPSIMLL